MDLVTLGWLALAAHGSPFMVGLAAFARAAPMMCGGAVRRHRGRPDAAGPRAAIAQTDGLIAGIALAVVFASGCGGTASLVGCEVIFGLRGRSIFRRGVRRSTRCCGAPRVAQAVVARDGVHADRQGAGALAAGLLPGARGRRPRATR
jgi:hypothetical protein